jgi:pyocin large subunit-like protein
MALITKGFESIAELKRHFSKHGHDFSATTADEYEQMADLFLGNGKPEGVHECVRNGGARLRYDPASESFGMLDARGVIGTYFKPVPCSTLPGAIREATRKTGNCHRHANNLVYFKAECKK